MFTELEEFIFHDWRMEWGGSLFLGTKSASGEVPVTPGQPPDRQERDLETFGGVKGLLISDLWTHLKVREECGRGSWPLC